ncbi:MAG: Cys-Gln thioester bond-forming surface protein, partial [Clostridia bacterium]|nr:Cys-Gln thioester bond-forming surface protein [Clostridia bacterium]
EDSGYYGPNAAKQIRAILLNSYPFISIEEMKVRLKNEGLDSEFVDSLNRADIIAAVQMAIWAYANAGEEDVVGNNEYGATYDLTAGRKYGYGSDPMHDYKNEMWTWWPTDTGKRSYDARTAYRVNNLTYFLCKLDGVEAQEDEVVISEVKVTRAELFGGSGDTYNIGMYIHLTGNDADDNLKVLITSTAPDGTVTGRSNQVVAGRDTLNMTVKSKPGDTIKVVVEGTQTVARGVYFYEPEPVYGSEDYDDDEAERKTSQSLVGVSEGATKVRAEEDFVFEQDIEKGLRIYKTAEGTGLPISDITFNVYEVDAEQDISAVPTESELEKYAVESNLVKSITTDSTGYAYLALEEGIYLVTENESDKVEAPVAPFYISIPMSVTKESDDGTTYTEVTNIASIYPKNKPTTPEEPPIIPPVPDEVKGRFAICKVNELNHDTLLAGAEFEIYRPVVESGENTKIITCEGVDYAVESTGHVITTDENGYVESPELDTGVYFLVETKAPDGFNLPAEAFKVYAESALLGEPKEVMIENAPGNILPETGGIGTHAFTATGWVMTMIAGAALVFRKKTKA